MNKQEPAITQNDRLKCTSKEGGGKSLAGNFAQPCSLREPLARVFEENSVVSDSERTTSSPRGSAPKTPKRTSKTKKNYEELKSSTR